MAAACGPFAPATFPTWPGSVKRLPKNLILAAVLVLAVFLVYGPSFSNGFIWDDDDYVTENPALDSPGGLFDIWFSPKSTPQYYPLVFTTFWIERRIFGLDPSGFHAVNAALHAMSALLLWRLLAMLGVPLAWFCAAIFALHPVNVESVAWITERKNLLSGVFYFAAAICFLGSWGVSGDGPAEGGPPEKPVRAGRLYVASFILFFCALLSKTVTSTLPAALVLVLLWKRRRVRLMEFLSLAPFFAMSLAFGLLTIWMERTHVGAGGADFDLGAAQRLLLAGRAFWFYAGKILWPEGFVFIYPRVIPDPSTLVSWLGPAGFAALVAALWAFRKKIGPGPLAAVLLFALALFPALGFFNVYPFRFSFVADHFQYLAGPCIMGLFASAFAAGLGWLGSLMGPRAARSLALVLMAAVLAFLGASSMVLALSYDGQERLWTATLQKNPAAWIAHNNLGVIRYGQGKFDEAEGHFRRVMIVKPDYAESFANLGAMQYKAGKPEKAEALFLEALALDPRLSTAHVNLAELYENAGKPGLAGKHYALALASDDRLAPAYEKIARMAAARGRADAALNLYRWAVDANPAWIPARERLGTLLASRGLHQEALPHLLAAFERQPDMEGLAGNLGLVYLSLGRADEALPVLEYAVSRRADDPRLLDFLGLALALSGRPLEGAARLREALSIDPYYAPARQHLAQINGGG